MRPVLFEIFGLPVKAYGFFLAISFWIGVLIVEREARRKGMNPDRIVDLAILSIITSLVGARLVFALLSWEFYARNPLHILYITEGGLSFHGGLAFAVIAGVVFCRKNGISPWEMADAVAPVIALGTAITRIGCFLNGCCYGHVSDVPWALQCSENDLLYRHPAQLYAVVLNFILFLYLWKNRQHNRFPSWLGWQYLIGYSVVRFVLEFFRESEYLWGWLTVAQGASVVVAAVSLLAIHLLGRKHSELSR